MNWRTPILRTGLKVFSPKILENLETIKELEKKSPEELKKLQDEKLKQLLVSAYQNVPYYTKVLREAKVIDKNLRVNLQNFPKIPILTKEIIRQNLDDLKSKDFESRKAYKNHSGGSTGEPLDFYQDKEYDNWNLANKIYYKTFVDQKIGDKELRLWASEAEFIKGREDPKIRIRNFLYNRKEMNAFKMSQEDLANFVKFWNSYRPRWVEGYALSLDELGKYIEENKLHIHSPIGILSTAETLSPEMQKRIEKTFNTTIYNRYGSREVGDVACSCDKGEGMHVSIWNNHIEILNEKREPVKPDELGKIYITNLNNYSMPLIRYEIGDIGSIPKKQICSCGRGTPLINNIEGRVVSMFKKKDGTLVSGGFFIHFVGSVFNTGFIKKFQVIQKDYDKIQIKIIVKNKKEFEKAKPSIEENIKKMMGENCSVEWKFVKDIPPLKSGKYLYTLCEV